MTATKNVLLIPFFQVSASSSAFNSAVVAVLLGGRPPCVLVSLCPYTEGTS